MPSRKVRRSINRGSKALKQEKQRRHEENALEEQRHTKALKQLQRRNEAKALEEQRRNEAKERGSSKGMTWAGYMRYREEALQLERRNARLAKLQQLKAQQDRLCRISNDMQDLSKYMNETLSMNLLNRILSFLSFRPQYSVGVGKMRRQSPVFKDCSSIETIGSRPKGDHVLLQLPPRSAPEVVTPIFPKGAVRASHVEVVSGALVSLCQQCALSPVAEQTLQTDGSRLTSLDIVEIAWRLNLHASVGDGCLKPNQCGDVLSLGPTFVFVNCNGKVWCYSKAAVHFEQLPSPRQCAKLAQLFEKHILDVGLASSSFTQAALGNYGEGQMPVIEVVQHSEACASIDPDEAQQISAMTSSTWIQHNIMSSVDVPDELMEMGAQDEDTVMEKVLVLQITRNPKELRDHLLGVDALEHVRHCLSSEGYDVSLPTGSLIFVSPLLYVNVRNTIQRRHKDLKCYHIIVSESLIPMVKDSLRAFPSKRNVRIRDDHTRVVGYASPSEDEFYIVQNTFLASARPMLSAQSVNQSTTEAHGSINPRRCNP